MPSLQFVPYTIPLLACALLSLALSIIVWNRRPGAGVIPFVTLTSAVAGWAILYVIELSIADLAAKIPLTILEYIGIVTVPAAWLTFSIEYTGFGKWVTRRNVLLLAIEPVLLVLLAITNNWHHWFWTSTSIEAVNGLNYFVNTKGWFFWVHAVYSYFIMMAATILLIRAIIRYPEAYRGQVLTVVLAVIPPWIINVFYILGINPFKPIDPTLFAFTFTGLFMGWSLIRYRLLDIVPVAREAVIESMKDAMLVIDRQGRVVDINPAALRVINTASKTGAIGKSLIQLVPAQRDLIQKYAQSDELQTEITFENVLGQPRTFELLLSPLRNRQGTLTGRVIVLRDITELKKSAAQIQSQNDSLTNTNRELAAARAQADAANRLKSEFLANMSHELRTPLNAILGYAQLQFGGMTGPMTEQQQGYQERILINGRHLLHLINEVLDLSKIEAGRMEIVQQPFNIRACLDETFAQNRVLADQKKLALEKLIADGLPEQIIGDEERIKQITINLLSNAIKFTEQGSVTLRVEQSTPDTWKLSVTDTGIGIPADKQEAIFDEFRQLDAGSTRQYDGTGLGLAIVRRLVQLMNGKITVRSEPGQGSTFEIVFPLIPIPSAVPQS